MDSQPGGFYSIIDTANRRAITVDPAHRQYSIYTGAAAVPKSTAKPSETIVIDISSKDTGERKTMFGREAQRWITTERRRIEYPDKPATQSDETVIEAWYIDVPNAPPVHSYTGVLTASGQPRPQIKVNRTGPAPRGIAVWRKAGNWVSEVTDISEAPLDPALFEPPAGFRRVVRRTPGQPLSWTDQILFYWQRFEDWVCNDLTFCAETDVDSAIGSERLQPRTPEKRRSRQCSHARCSWPFR